MRGIGAGNARSAHFQTVFKTLTDSLYGVAKLGRIVDFSCSSDDDGPLCGFTKSITIRVEKLLICRPAQV